MSRHRDTPPPVIRMIWVYCLSAKHSDKTSVVGVFASDGGPWEPRFDNSPEARTTIDSNGGVREQRGRAVAPDGTAVPEAPGAYSRYRLHCKLCRSTLPVRGVTLNLALVDFWDRGVRLGLVHSLAGDQSSPEDAAKYGGMLSISLDVLAAKVGGKQ